MPWTSAGSYSSTCSIVQHNHPNILASSGSSFRHKFTHSASRTSRINHGAHDTSLGNDTSRPRSVPNRSRQIRHEALSSSSNRLFPSPMAYRTLASGQMLFYLRDATLADCIVKEFREALSGPLGFDIEYRPNFIKGRPLNKTALVQLASASIIFLVQVSAMSAFPDIIRNIIEDPAIIKAGVGIQGDADKLRKDFGVNPASCLELGYFARAIDQQWADTAGLISLARLVKAYGDRDFKKPKSIQMSNWERSLTERQQDYAADDANAALFVVRKLYAILPSVQPPPARTLYLF